MKRTPFLIALLNPANLAILGLTIAAGLCSAWWLAPIGLILWIVLMLIIAREPSLQFSHVLESREPLAARFQKKFESINRSQTRLFNSIISSRTKIRRELQPVLKVSSQLVDAAYSLCLRLTPMENNRLVTQSTGGLILELENMQVKIENAKDPIIRKEYEQATDSIKERIEKIREFTTQLDRVDAQLISLKSNLEELHAQVVSLQSKNVGEISHKVSLLLEELQKELNAFQQFEQENFVL
jgi:chromosome segregation ATPase